MGQLVRAFKRLYLKDVDPTYAVEGGKPEDQLYIDVRLGFTNAQQRALTEANEVQDKEMRARREAMQNGAPVPPLTRAWYDADNRVYATYAVASNITADLDGNPLPACTEADFWAAMPGDVKDAVVAIYQAARKEREERLSGEDFTKRPAGS